MPIRDEQNQGAYMCITAVSVITAICWWWMLWNVDRKHQMRHLSLFPGFFFSPLWIWYYTFFYRVTVVPAEAKLSSRTEIEKLSWTEVIGNPTEPTLCFLSILVERCQWWDQPKSTKSFGCFEVFWSRGLTSCVVTTGKMRKRDFELPRKSDWESKSPNDR